MSLRVWLPLNGDLDNLGLSALTTSGTPIWKTYGKIGSKALDLQNRITFSTPDLNGVQFFSVAFWGRIEANSATTANWMDVIGFYDVSTGGTSGQFRFETGYGNTAQGGIHWHDNATNAIIDGSYTYNTAAEQNNWHHIVVTVSNTELDSYYDGQLVNTKTTNLNKGHLNGSWWIGESTSRGCIQDVRIYDHALSAKEVEEIAKGLVVHYKLDNNGLGGENLLSQYVIPGQAAPTSTATGGRTNYLGDYKISIPAIENADTYFRLFTTQQLTANTVYTISCYVDGLKDGSYYNFPLYSSSNGSMGVFQLNHNGLCSLTFTMTYTGAQTAATGKNGETVYICFMDDSARAIASGQGAITLSNFKLEKGSNVTSWSPAKTDPLYATITGGQDIIYDVSGYSHHGVPVGTITVTNPSPRYSAATHFNGTDNCIRVPFNEVCPDNIFTINLWFKKDALGSKGYETLFGGPSGFEMDTRAGNATVLSLYMASTRGSTVFSPFNLGEWYMVTMVRDGTNELYYVNGELKKTISAKAMPTGVYRIGAWASDTGQNYYGEISDFRIYNTPLTANNIKELYNTSMTIDNNGNIMAREVIE